MGNCVSCALTTSLASHSKMPRVIFPSGEVKHLDRPLAAAELMLDNPGHFLVNSRSMQIGRRFFPLAADEDLDVGQVYVMVSMNRVNGIVGAGDMGRIFVAAEAAVRRASGGRARVLPEFSGKMAEAIGGRIEKEEFRYRASMCRSRRPVLETILEESICCST